MPHFALRLVHGPAWDDMRPIREQDGWPQHAAFMDGLVAEGVVLLGGPVGDPADRAPTTMHVAAAASADQLRARLRDDPWAVAGLLEVASIEPWALWLDFRTAPPADA